MSYIHELKNWTEFRWDRERVSELLTFVRHRQGRLIGRMEGLGFNLRSEAVLQSLTEEVIKTSQIEGENLDRESVRSSVAKRLGIDAGGLTHSDRNVEGIVEILLDATQNFNQPLTQNRLSDWHAALFPTGRSGMTKIIVGKWREDQTGPMQVISGPIGREHVHFEAPASNRLQLEMTHFLNWVNSEQKIDPVLKAGLAHFWFITVHPFEDGNGRIARAITDQLLARSENSAQRFYSMSAQINQERKDYYDILESTQRGTLDVTKWLVWFLECLGRAFDRSESVLGSVLKKSRFWEKHNLDEFNDRQRKVLNQLLDGFDGKLTSTKWAAIAKCSQDTASRDMEDLVVRGVMIRNPGGGRSTSYSLVELK